MSGGRGHRRYDVRVRDVLDHAARLFGLSLEELTGRSRKRWPVLARHAAVWVIRNRVGMSYPEITRFFAITDHSTLIHAVQTCEERMALFPDYACKVRTLRWLAEGGEVLPDAGQFRPAISPCAVPKNLVWRRAKPEMEDATKSGNRFSGSASDQKNLLEDQGPEPVAPLEPQTEPRPSAWWERSDDELLEAAIAGHRARGGDFVEVFS
jgi:hypothetical protein